MNDKSKSPVGTVADEASLEAAARWWLRLRGTDSADVAEQWLKWSSDDAEHADAFERVAELGSQLAALDASTKSSLAAEFASRAAMSRIGFARRPMLFAAAAAVLAFAVLGAGFFTWFQSSAPTERAFSSQVGENRSLTLKDGSQVVLGGASAIKVRYGEHQREIVLQKGEAYFVDTHDPERPFVVVAGKLSTRALGTAFDVRRAGAAVIVGVAEGRVLVAQQGTTPSSNNAVEAAAGQQVTYRPSAAGLTIHEIDASKVATWRDRQFSFDDEPLSGVVAQLNRYIRRPMRVQGDSLNTLKFTGTVNLDNFGGWLRALPAIFPIKVTRRSDAIVLSPAAVPHKRD